jgi:hypothetical protein
VPNLTRYLSWAGGRDRGNGYKALGIDVLPKLLARADQVME